VTSEGVDWFLNDYPGFIGLRPPHNNTEARTNIVCQMLRDNIIDRPMFSVFIQFKNFSSTVNYNAIMFGGYYEKSFLNDSDKTVFESIDPF
jgi:hypothetical protein